MATDLTIPCAAKDILRLYIAIVKSDGIHRVCTCFEKQDAVTSIAETQSASETAYHVADKY